MNRSELRCAVEGCKDLVDFIVYDTPTPKVDHDFYSCTAHVGVLCANFSAVETIGVQLTTEEMKA